MYKVVIFDLDGTLAESKQSLTPEMGQALKQLLDKMPVAIMSGGDLPQFEKQLLPHLPADSKLDNLFIFPTSAAKCFVYDGRAWRLVYEHLLTREEKEKVIEAIRKVLDATKLVEGEPAFGERIEDRGAQITFSALGQEAPLDLKVRWDPQRTKRSAIKKELDRLLPEFEVRIGGVTSIDVNKKGVDKTTGIQWLAKRFDTDPSGMLYVGDALSEGGNDNVVISTGVHTKAVAGPPETLAFIQTLI